MPGTGKRAHAADSSEAGNEQAPASKQQRTDSANWCVDCWAPPKDACRGDHSLLDRTAAERDLQEQLTAVRTELTKLQARLDALGKARLLDGPVLLASIDESDGSFDGWIVQGGDIRIALASNLCLTGEDKEKILEALGGVGVEYDVDGNQSVMAHCEVDDLDGLLDKFPDLVVGQEVRDGDVLLNAKRLRLEVYFKGTEVKESGSKQFGAVKDGLKALQAEGCPSDGSYASVKDECCSGGEENCFCMTRRPGSSYLYAVKFENKDEDKNEDQPSGLSRE
ncbi:uncharacterized protein LOC117639542 [Thrips palmi]|uniref:Uncharacterized protein LOC117639542 n=1 Tax=Thrips palmi TaxID=161013 RepID=A0A6P8Y483_THRPL|nr:uncharacterized protein LOC117639542 [Thrips palmi]XP_034231210.1 uncharacterized protein LOC117639542 [Thrips palmi]XP_034231211.1 uncharacterized protein LOC117639542 [Thrips palmi]XP_034231212.1 uncharacterized protein LOC117639542 [Thrips palmi]XP_034231214.1 uncharacterized protein LOC117639542 [Thrips palmi]XP_034231215.1 uncharacterized protein LOC117639542 [Thrips palmi]